MQCGDTWWEKQPKDDRHTGRQNNGDAVRDRTGGRRWRRPLRMRAGSGWLISETNSQFDWLERLSLRVIALQCKLLQMAGKLCCYALENDVLQLKIVGLIVFSLGSVTQKIMCCSGVF